jgi:TRAP-type C4-dicarboxylate transport system permease small subunit
MRSKRLSRLFDKILLGTCYAAGAIMLVLMLSITYEVVMRYFFNSPTKWALDFGGYMQYAITLLGAAWVLKIEGHPRIDMLVVRASLKKQAVTKIITSTIGLLACLLFSWEGLRATLTAYEKGDFLFRQVEVPLAPLYALIPFSFILVTIEFGRKICDEWHKLGQAQTSNRKS